MSREDKRLALTERQEELLIRLKQAGGYSNKRLAEIFGVHRNTVSNIITRHARKAGQQ